MKIEELELTVRSNTALNKAGITTVEQLVSLEFWELQETPGLGHQSVAEVCWACVRLLSGKMTEEISRFNLREKAEKYDKIARIVGTGDRVDLDIAALHLDIRSESCLRAEGIATIGDLLRWTKRDLLKTPNLGKRSLGGIVDALEERGLYLKA